MKKLLFFIPALLFCVNTFGQTLTFKDLLNLANGQDVKAYLISKSFTLTDNTDKIEFYYLNKGTKSEQRVMYVPNKNGISYNTRDLHYVNGIIKEAGKKLHLMLTDDNSQTTFYSFSGLNVDLHININKIQGVGVISIGKLNP